MTSRYSPISSERGDARLLAPQFPIAPALVLRFIGGMSGSGRPLRVLIVADGYPLDLVAFHLVVRHGAERAELLAALGVDVVINQPFSREFASITAEDVRNLRQQFPGVPVVTYVNTYADVKAESDICCTSSNAKAVVESLHSETVIFLPDQYLGRWVASQLPDAGGSHVSPQPASTEALPQAEQMPDKHTSLALQPLPSSHRFGRPVQTPAPHTSPTVQAFPSLQGAVLFV